MTDTVQVPRELVLFLLGEAEIDGRWFGEQVPRFLWRRTLRKALYAAPPVAAEPVAEVTAAARLQWLVDADRAASLIGTKLYTHPKEPVNQQLLEALRMAEQALRGKAYDEEGYCLDPDLAEDADKARAAIAAAEAQPALEPPELQPLGDLVGLLSQLDRIASSSINKELVRLLSEFVERYAGQRDSRSQYRSSLFDEARAALQAALDALKE